MKKLRRELILCPHSVGVCFCEVGERPVQVQAQGGAGVFPTSQLPELLPEQQLSVGAAAAGVSGTAR